MGVGFPAAVGTDRRLPFVGIVLVAAVVVDIEVLDGIVGHIVAAAVVVVAGVAAFGRTGCSMDVVGRHYSDISRIHHLVDDICHHRRTARSCCILRLDTGFEGSVAAHRFHSTGDSFDFPYWPAGQPTVLPFRSQMIRKSNPSNQARSVRRDCCTNQS